MYSSAPFLIERRPASAFSNEGIRSEIEAINHRSDEIGCVFYPGEDQSKTLVLFAGHGEKFYMLSVARSVRCNVLYFQDPKSHWYRGGLLPDIRGIAEFLENRQGDTTYLLFGQSSGGYAALAASCNLKNSMAVAVSPQTFPDQAAKQAIHFGRTLRPVHAANDILDLQSYLHKADATTRRAIIFSSCEVQNPYEDFMWLDHLHAVRMIGTANIGLYIAKASRHSIALKRGPRFASLIADLLQNPVQFHMMVASHVDEISIDGS